MTSPYDNSSHLSNKTSAPLNNLDDAEVVRIAQGGGLSAFEEIIARFEGRIFKYLLGRTANRHDAEDILQETFFQAYRKLELYDDRWSIGVWLFAIASNLATNKMGKKRPAALDDADLIAVSGGDPLMLAEKKETNGNLWTKARKSLTTDQYDAIWMKYAEGMDIRQIANAMNKSAGNVKVLLFRARTTLGKMLANDNPSPATDNMAQQFSLGDST